ncbi:hypothetical protein CP02DC16_0724B, partial [Chlamydia psittaci 02DC16]
RGP